jgi:hypothetical protein
VPGVCAKLRGNVTEPSLGCHGSRKPGFESLQFREGPQSPYPQNQLGANPTFRPCGSHSIVGG